MQYPEHAIATLKKNGFRITTPRSAVIQLLDSFTTPLSPYDVVDQLKSTIKIDSVTVYRIFECLEQNGLIHRVLNTGKFVKCQISRDATHSEHQCCHHLVVCEKCGLTREIHCHLPIDVADLPDMKIIGHRLELIGRCTQCSATTLKS